MIYFNIFKFYSIIPWLQWLHNGHRGGQEELLHIQSQEQWLRFAGTATKRYPTSKVGVNPNPSETVGTERGHERTDRLKPQSQTTGQSDHMDHSLV